MTDKVWGSVVEEGIQEGVEAWDIERLAAQDDEPSTEQLRELLGDRATDLSDEDLQALWTETKAGEKAEEGKAEAKDEPKAEGTKDEGGEASSADEAKPDEPPAEGLSFKSADDLLAHKLTTTIDKQSVELSVADALRLAQRQPLNERRIATALEQRNEVSLERDQLARDVEGLKKDVAFARWVFDDPSGKRFQQAQEHYERAKAQGGFGDTALSGQPPAPTDGTPGRAGGRVGTDFTAEQEAAGSQWYAQHGKPIVQSIARSYSADGNAPPVEHAQSLELQIEQELSNMIAQEGRFLTADRLREMFEVDLPHKIEMAGWKRVGGNGATAPTPAPAASPPPASNASPEIAALRAEVANVKTRLARMKTQQAPAGSGSGGGGGGSGSPKGLDRVNKAKTAREVMEALQDPDETFGLE